MIGGSRSIAALLATCLLTSPALVRPALADPSSAAANASPKDRQVASDLVKKAIARSQAGDHAAAIEIYLQAYTLVPDDNLLANIGTQFQQAGQLPQALHYFCEYLNKQPNGANAEYATMQAKSVQTTLGKKHVTEDNMCDEPKRGGKNGIKTRHEGTEEPTPDDQGDKPEPQPTKAGPGKPDKPDKDPGGGGDPLDLTAPAQPPVHPSDSDTASSGNGSMRTAGYAVTAAGAVLLGVGVYAGVKAKDISDEISNHPASQPWPNGIQTEQAHGQHYEDAQVITLIGGAAAVGVGIYLIIHAGASADDTTDKPADKSGKSADRAVHLTPTTNGFAIFGKF